MMLELNDMQINEVSGGALTREQALCEVGSYLQALGEAINWVDNNIFPSLSGADYRTAVSAWAEVFQN
jgi:hypothetical protein